MSATSSIFAIKSLGPILNAIASRDQRIVSAIASAHPSEEEIAAIAADMIMRSSPPDPEPGSWAIVLPELGKHFEVCTESFLPFNRGWKHARTWSEYVAETNSLGVGEASRLLEYLRNGRALRASQIDCGEALYAWLDNEEVLCLLEALTPLEEHDFAQHEIGVFHELLVDSLEMIKPSNASLLLTAT